LTIRRAAAYAIGVRGLLQKRLLLGRTAVGGLGVLAMLLAAPALFRL
jgi:hypothetical protein